MAFDTIILSQWLQKFEAFFGPAHSQTLGNPLSLFENLFTRSLNIDTQCLDYTLQSSLTQCIEQNETLFAESKQNGKKSNGFFVEDILRPDFGVPSVSSPKCESNVEQATCLEDDVVSSNSSGQSRTNRVQVKSGSSSLSVNTINDNEEQYGNSPSLPQKSRRNAHKDVPLTVGKMPLPAWVFCTRYSDRPSSGPRTRKPRKFRSSQESNLKRPRTSFTAGQLRRLAKEFEANRYLDENRRNKLAKELDLRESQVKIWFQNKRAKTKKATCSQDRLAFHLMAEGLYNHSVRTKMALDEDEDTCS